MMAQQLLLGTAQWGWTIAAAQAYDLLDAFYQSGFRQIDSATNYPINKNERDFRQAEKIIASWTQAHGVQDLELMMKVGSVNNNRTSECNLNPSFLLMALENYQRLFGTNLKTIMLHWDNREDKKEIFSTINTLRTIHNQGFNVGLSGIKYPELYAALLQDIVLDFDIQIKYNILQSDYERYADFHGTKRFIAYGTNAGGVKLDASTYQKESVLAVRGGNLTNEHLRLKQMPTILAKANENKDRPSITSFFQIGLLYALANKDIKSVIIAPSSVAQWYSTLGFFKNIQHFDYEDIVKEINQVLP
jgi:aryl-alcohol dehydrogenase-like predicted oxidoreductase